MAQLFHLSGQTPEEEKRLKGNAYRNEWKRRKRAENPEKYRREAREYRAKNLEARRAWDKQWREKNLLKCKAYQRKSYVKNHALVLVRMAKSRAATRGVEFSLTKEWALGAFTGKCALTGIPFDMTSTGSPTPHSPSLDRIDPMAGYTPENCRFVLWQVNIFKQRMTDAQMFELARAILNGAQNG